MLFVSVENCPEYLLFMESIFEGTKWSRNNTIISNFCKIQSNLRAEKWGNSFRNVPWNFWFSQIFHLVLLLLERNQKSSSNLENWINEVLLCGSVLQVICNILSVLLLLQWDTDPSRLCDGTDGYWWSGSHWHLSLSNRIIFTPQDIHPIKVTINGSCGTSENLTAGFCTCHSTSK